MNAHLMWTLSNDNRFERRTESESKFEWSMDFQAEHIAKAIMNGWDNDIRAWESV